jgi:hypothetical protein
VTPPENSVRRRQDTPTREWRVIQRWPNGDELAIEMVSGHAARERQAVLDANHPSGFQRRIEVVRIECREVGRWTPTTPEKTA